MIQAVLWLWGLARALQRPLEGQPCPWCGRCYTTPHIAAPPISAADFAEALRQGTEPPTVGGDITVAVPPGTDPGQVAAEISRRFREQRDNGRS